MSEKLSPEIYVACLSAYNNGILYGQWIDATQPVEIVREAIAQMLKKSPIPGAEEWAIHGSGDFGDTIKEYESLESVYAKSLVIEEYGSLGLEALNYFPEVEEAREQLEEHYHGEYDSPCAFATQLFDELYLDSIPEPLQSYIDYEAFARDIFIDDYYFLKVGHHTHVFSRH